MDSYNRRGETVLQLPRWKERCPIRVVGIDPGSLACGYGVVERDSSKELVHVSSGVIRLPRKEPLYVRLKLLHEQIREVVRSYAPGEAAVEKVFFAKSVKAALHLGQARGVLLLAIAEEGVRLHEYSPNEVKMAVVGYGRAEKRQVQRMVKTILALDDEPLSDSADALALAICHLNTMNFSSSLSRGKGSA